jgi:hypothetical protein
VPSTIPCGWVSSNVNGGDGGRSGMLGQPGQPGNPGNGARGGNPGPNINMEIFGNPGMASVAGDWGERGSEGPSGSPGPAGPNGIKTCVQRPGGGGDQPPPCASAREDEPSNVSYCDCTNYWWVEYRSDDGGETWYIYDYWYAGCW